MLFYSLTAAALLSVNSLQSKQRELLAGTVCSALFAVPPLPALGTDGNAHPRVVSEQAIKMQAATQKPVATFQEESVPSILLLQSYEKKLLNPPFVISGINKILWVTGGFASYTTGRVLHCPKSKVQRQDTSSSYFCQKANEGIKQMFLLCSTVPSSLFCIDTRIFCQKYYKYFVLLCPVLQLYCSTYKSEVVKVRCCCWSFKYSEIIFRRVQNLKWISINVKLIHLWVYSFSFKSWSRK